METTSGIPLPHGRGSVRVLSRARKHAETRRRGGALLAVLWLSAALAAIAFSLANTVRGEVERTSTVVDSLRSYYLATGAIQRTVLYMLRAPQPSRLSLSFPGGDALVEVIPEAAKLNVNQAPAEDLFRLLLNLGVPQDRAREITLGILDWRAPAPPGQLSPFDHFYASLAPTFRARHASFEEIEELLLIKGMTPDIYYGTQDRRGLNGCLSVFGSIGPVDANTADPAVLATIGLSPEAAAALVERRRVMPFRNPAELGAFIQGAGPGAARLRLGGNSIFTVRATARLRLANSQLSDLRRTAAALVKIMPPGYDAPYHILRWYDTAWSH